MEGEGGASQTKYNQWRFPIIINLIHIFRIFLPAVSRLLADLSQLLAPTQNEVKAGDRELELPKGKAAGTT